MHFPVFGETSTVARLVALLFCLLFAASAPAATYHVSNSASSDSYPGTEAQPFATVAHAITASSSGDTIHLARGSTFREGGLNLRRSRTLGAYGDASLPQPVLSGSDVITGWAPVAPGSPVLVTTPAVGSLITQLYLDGKRLTLARTPDTGWLRCDEGSDNNTIVDAELPTLPGAAPERWTGAQVRWRKWSWIYETRTIAEDDGAGTLALAGVTKLNETGIDTGYFIDNSLDALDAPGEWFYDSVANVLYLYPPDGANLHNARIEAVWRSLGATVTASTVEDITIRHFVAKGLDLHDPCHIRRCTLEQIDGTGIFGGFNTGGSQVTDCSIRDILDRGLDWYDASAGPSETIIEHNTFERIGSVPGLGGSGSWHHTGVIISRSPGLTFRLNHLCDIGYAGVLLGYDGQTVTRNVFRRCMSTLNDGAAIYTNCSASHITENIILDTVGNLESSHKWVPLGHGIWPEFLSEFHDSEIVANTVYGSGGNGLWLPNNYRCTVADNVVVSNRRAALRLGGFENQFTTPDDWQQNHSITGNLLAVGVSPWRPFPGQIIRVASWAPVDSCLVGFVTFTDRDLDYGTMADTTMLTPTASPLVKYDDAHPLTLAEWQSTEAAWADPAPTAYQGNGYLFINDTESTVDFPLPPGVAWQQLSGAATGSTVSITPFRSVVLTPASGSAAGLSPYYLASGEAGPLSYEEWIASYGFAGVSAAPDADPDADGLPNLVEYTGALSPQVADANAPLTIATAPDGAFTITLRERTGISSSTRITLQTSADMQTWTDLDSTNATVGAAPGEPFVCLVSLVVRPPAQRAFFRLKIVRN